MKFRLNEDSNGGQRTFKQFLSVLFKTILNIDIDPDLYHLHHIDGNHSNNDPSNLALMLSEKHRKLHGAIKGKNKSDYSTRLINEFHDNVYQQGTYYVGRCLEKLLDNLTDSLNSAADADEEDIESKLKSSVGG